MTPYILIFFLSTSGFANSGVGGITHEFSSKATCMAAGAAIAADAESRYRKVLTWGCFEK